MILPIKSLLMNVLNLSAVFGILVLDLPGRPLRGPARLHEPGRARADACRSCSFAVAFGLSTDYGVFLLSRIKEARDSGASDSESVASGLERTGRIVTAAALLFAVAIGAFATSQIVFIKENGVGTALAVLIDATHHPRPARAVADGAARQVELVGTAAAATPARSHRRE